jgi:hypothetical protein
MNLRASIFVSALLAALSLACLAQETNSVEGLDFDSFKIITQRNIFDPTRSGRRVGRERPQLRIERVLLVGTVVDPREEAAQFTGAGVPDKFLKVGDSLKDLKVVQITEDGVRLKGQSNTFVLDFEKRRSLRREENGPWQGSSDISDPAPVASANADEAGSSASTPALKPASGPDSDIIERLRKRKMEEK